MNYLDKYKLWLSKTEDKPELFDELRAIASDENEIEDRFYKGIEFGTGGLRGVLGAGTNRMNVYVISKASQGLSMYLKSLTAAPSVAIAYDSRINSDVFAHAAAEVFAGNGIKVYIYPKLMPTPSLSFAVRQLHCTGGVVVTASHNPAEYNGYKVYGADGCQITSQAAAVIQKLINSVDEFDGVSSISFDKALSDGLIEYISEETVEEYINEVSLASVLPEGIARELKIAYTPLNGAGISCVPRCLEKNGFGSIVIPDEQHMPDGHFPTCPYPNPEIREALTVGLRCAEENDCELLIATDPDCDRVGAAVKTDKGYETLSGNEMGVLLFDFICKTKKLPESPVAVKTIVTTPMAAKIAEEHGIELIDVLTGFKYIGETIGELEKKGRQQRFVFGFEESCGYLSNTCVRDKDAVNACLLICEMTAYYKAQKKTLIDALLELYNRYGWCMTRLVSYQFAGIKGFEDMTALLKALRETEQESIAGIRVLKRIDYKTDKTSLPRADVLRYFLEGGSEVVVRPSGTEPKLKIYLTGIGASAEDGKALVENIKEYFDELIDR